MNADQAASVGRQKYYSAAEVERLQAEITEAKEAAGRAEQRAREARGTGAPAVSRPACSSPYGALKYEKPFLVRAIWHDGQFTYLKSDATELPALYETEGRQARRRELPGPRTGTYVVPKVLERGYLALGNARFSFEQRER